MRSRHDQPVAVLLAFLAGIALTLIGFFLAPQLRRAASGLPGAERSVSAASAVGTQPAADPSLVRNAAAKLTPSVVSIHTQGKPQMINAAPNPFAGDPFLRRFFGDSPFGSSAAPQRLIPKGAGSGVIISSDGYVLTNAHVTHGADKVQVEIGGKGYDAQVKGEDELSDIAVLKVDPQGQKLAVAELGNSDQVRVGDWAIAVGNPLDVGTSVTLGIVSAINRRIDPEGHPLQSLLQTDAAINPGNSGGALANIDGQVIGINEAIATPNGGSVGIGFAIPIAEAKKISDELIRTGKVTRPYLGISYAPLKALPPQAREKLGLRVTGDAGVVVERVVPGSPADQAGLKAHDVILEAAGQKLTDAQSLNAIVQGKKVGETLPLRVARDGADTTLHVTLRERPADYGRSPELPQR